MIATLPDAERQANARLRQAAADAEEIFANARAEALAILDALPDFAALETRPSRPGRTAFAAMRGVADRHGFAFAALMGSAGTDKVKQARAEAMRAVAQACPTLLAEDIAPLFKASVQAVRLALRRPA